MTKHTPPLISVILPVYNCAAYVSDTIYSILNQTIQDFEILVIDDCSTDNTVDIIQNFEDKRIFILLKKQNMGLIDSLNIGFKQAKGKYIARMDGDDINHLQRFEKQLNILQNNSGIKVCGCWLQEFGDRDKIIKHKEFHDQIVASLLVSCSMSLGSVMMCKEWSSSFKFDSTKKHVEDYDLWSRVSWEGKLYNIQEVLYFYRRHNSQVSRLFLSLQREGDIKIKLFLFKKIKFDRNKYTDCFIEKMLSETQVITVKDFKKYREWLGNIIKLNQKQRVFEPTEFKKVMHEMQTALIFKIYFKDTNIGITKNWRMKALYYLPYDQFIMVIKSKVKEIFKRKR